MTTPTPTDLPEALRPQDHPDFIGGMVYTDAELRHIERHVQQRIAAAISAAAPAAPAEVGGPTYLCKAWGETDLPAAAIVRGLDGVRQFLVEQWLGSKDKEADDGTRMLPAAIEDMQDEWRREGEAWEWSAEFEIGGVSVQKVADFTPAAPQAQQPTAPQEGAESYPPLPRPAWDKRTICTTSDAYSDRQMRDYADATTALRARGAVPSDAPAKALCEALEAIQQGDANGRTYRAALGWVVAYLAPDMRGAMAAKRYGDCLAEAKRRLAAPAAVSAPSVVDDVAKDAARYRWLRDDSVPPHNFYLSVPDEFKDELYTRAEVDAAIDAAMLAATPQAPAGEGGAA